MNNEQTLLAFGQDPKASYFSLHAIEINNFQWNDGQIGAPIIVPDGYELVVKAVSHIDGSRSISVFHRNLRESP